MAQYGAGEARDWAREHMKGVCGCLLPTLSSSLRAVNEAAIRHDVRREAELGFWGTLLVSECGTTKDEMREVVDIAVDEAAKVGLRTVMHASFPTLEDAIEMVGHAERAGADLVLMSYPLTFHPRSEDEVYAYTKAIADSTSLGIMLFCIGLWDFGRLHPSGFSPRLIGRLIDGCDNVVAIKNEIGAPGIAGIAEVFHRFGDRVVVCDPFEMNAPAWTTTFGMPFMGTSNYEYMGGEVPRYFGLLQEGRFDDAMEIYWRLHPARQANARAMGEFAATGLINRMLWKYQYWLSGFNGGPVRQPHLRLYDRQMAMLRKGAADAGLEIAEGTDDDFFAGRHPME